VGFLFYGKRAKTTQAKQVLRMEDEQMADQAVEKKSARTLSLDEWAVAIALLLAALVRLGVLKHVGW
jgi:hypothetical protein